MINFYSWLSGRTWIIYQKDTLAFIWTYLFNFYIKNIYSTKQLNYLLSKLQPYLSEYIYSLIYVVICTALLISYLQWAWSLAEGTYEVSKGLSELILAGTRVFVFEWGVSNLNDQGTAGRVLTDKDKPVISVCCDLIWCAQNIQSLLKNINILQSPTASFLLCSKYLYVLIDYVA